MCVAISPNENKIVTKHSKGLLYTNTWVRRNHLLALQVSKTSSKKLSTISNWLLEKKCQLSLMILNFVAILLRSIAIYPWTLISDLFHFYTFNIFHLTQSAQSVAEQWNGLVKWEQPRYQPFSDWDRKGPKISCRGPLINPAFYATSKFFIKRMTFQAAEKQESTAKRKVG